MQETKKYKRTVLETRLRKSVSQDALDLKEYLRLYLEEAKDKLLRSGAENLAKAQAEALLLDRIYKALTVAPPIEHEEN